MEKYIFIEGCGSRPDSPEPEILQVLDDWPGTYFVVLLRLRRIKLKIDTVWPSKEAEVLLHRFI